LLLFFHSLCLAFLLPRALKISWPKWAQPDELSSIWLSAS
jgi:hypothetical protein